MSHWQLIVTPLTPVHIAAGDTIEPFEYVIDGQRLYKFDPPAFLARLAPDEQNEFVDLAGSDILKARQFLHARREIVRAIADYSLPVSLETARLYEDRLANPQSDLGIGVFIRSHHQPYIPGSSLKGALRTALLFSFATRSGEPIRETDGRWAEARVFNYVRRNRDNRDYISVQDDPFKTIKVSDSQAREMTRLAAVSVHTRKKEGWSPAAIPLLREVTLSKLSDAQSDPIMLSLSIDETLTRYTKNLMRIGVGDIIEGCRQFYRLHLEQEVEFHRGLKETELAFQALLNWDKQLPPHAFLLRLGWGSGFDAVTVRYGRESAHSIDELRTKRDKRDQDDDLLYTPASRHLVEGGFPLGWVEVNVLPVDETAKRSLESEAKRLATTPVVRVVPQARHIDKTTQPRTEATVEDLAAKFGKKKQGEKREKPKSTAGEKAKRELDEIHRKMLGKE